MTTVTEGQRVLTPPARRIVLRSLFWVGAGVFALVIAFIAMSVAGGGVGGPPLSASNPAPPGAMAVAEVLRQQGVTVTETSSLEETRDAVEEASSTTLFIYDEAVYLSDTQLRQAVALAENVIIAAPGFNELQAIAPGVAQAGRVTGPVEADCDVSAVERAGTVTGDGLGYRLIDQDVAATTCLGSGDGVYSLIRLETESGRLSILGATDALSNEFVAGQGNAAFALGLLGETENLVWYLPSIADLPPADAQTIGELTPAWVTPVLSLLVLTFIAAAIWRGRRFGPLVVENLPVTVRASETMLGRARLYQKSSARLRALDALRVGSVQRLAPLCGLPRLATVDEVISSVASVTGAQEHDIRRLLVDAVPHTDHDLVQLSDALLTLERDVARVVRP